MDKGTHARVRREIRTLRDALDGPLVQRARQVYLARVVELEQYLRQDRARTPRAHA